MEIERKYLVDPTLIVEELDYISKEDIIQGYLLSNDNSELRVRLLSDNFGHLAVKNRVGVSEVSRDEFEIPLSREEFLDLYKSCKKSLIKTRYKYEYKNQLFEIDVYKGHLSGLITAEVELEWEDQGVVLPEFIIEEITDDSKYKNKNLAK